ncbi:MAG: STAS/SEC14 domain-containing protein [Desulfarculaceae bacterium]|nr:STAS/SEC14 domain-containing protein [Desulfarculaceae bacterium]MCF8073675.1 STAS/SEC14 domain-containing protein [Desulfarculaceae bacterium]MCF8101916.1 STAS/SEC14 domain-containing protein [Desulfarculaceae bacterium]MCF8117661.1 STAS/SEC14 domain-containing protein [Desulfarculaceae bacterium]
MFKVLDGSAGDVLGVEISQEYTKADVEKFKEAFEEALAASGGQVNILVKMDQLPWTKVKLDAFIEDARYALKFKNSMRHLAIVGDSSLMAPLVKLDNLILGKPEEGLIEKYFDVGDMDQAWAFVRS